MEEFQEGRDYPRPETSKPSRDAERGALYRDLIGPSSETEKQASRAERPLEVPPLRTGREPLRVKEVDPAFAKFDADHNVEMLSEHDREQFRVFAGGDGKLYGSDGLPLDTASADSVHNGSGYAIFVMDNQGNLYVSSHQTFGEFHHSSLLGGEPVAGAG